MPGDPRRNVQPQAAFTQLMLERDTNWRLPLQLIRETLFDFTPPLTDPKVARVWAQRKTRSKVGSVAVYIGLKQGC